MAKFIVVIALFVLLAVAFGAPQQREREANTGAVAKSGDLDTASSFYGGFYGGYPYGGYGYGHGFGGPFYGGYGGYGYGYGHPYGGFGYGFY